MLQVDRTITCLEGLLVDCRYASDLDAHILWVWMEMIAEILSRSNSPRLTPAELAL